MVGGGGYGMRLSRGRIVCGRRVWYEEWPQHGEHLMAAWHREQHQSVAQGV